MLKDIEMSYLKNVSVIDILLGSELKEENIAHISELKVSDGVYVGELDNLNNYFEAFDIHIYDMYQDKELMSKSAGERLKALENRNELYGFTKEMPYFSDYGVCDHYQQVLDLYPEMVTNTSEYFIFLTPVTKLTQPSYGGWRWHKWGKYIGTQDPQAEYLADEPEIEEVYCYHIYKLSTTQLIAVNE